ncbi:MAG: DNA polymerase IV [Deltaproteobacteria bacterium]|nr:DNA polymerase IV [Deltaproteobacteria bacterium]
MSIIGHLDMDAFFAAVEERDNPRFRGLPLVVGADPENGKGRGVVSTANYAARRYGIHSAMPITKAWRLSEAARRRGEPEVVFVQPHFSRYAEISERIMSIVHRRAPLVEEAGIDEAYLDLTFAGTFEKAREICSKIKQEIKAQENLTASLGIGPNKLIAKIASDFQKPDGLTVVTAEAAEEFLAPLPVRQIPGVGPKTQKKLAAKGIFLVRDLKRFSAEELQAWFGKWGLDLFEKVRGRGSTTLTLSWEPKSIGEQETFARDTLALDFVFKRLWDMCRRVWQRLCEEGFRGYRTVAITVRFADFQTQTRSYTLAHPANSLKTLQFEAMKLFMPFVDYRENPRHKLIRLIGVRVEKLIK